MRNDLTEHDGASQTFWPVKFSPPHFFLKSYLSYVEKLVSIKEKYLWPPRGTWGGYKGVRPPKKEKSCFQPYFWRKKIPFTSRIIWDITTKPHSLQKLGVDPFLVQKWTKNCKKTADFKVAKKICLTVNFLFYSKNQLFQTSSIAQIFKNQEFCHSGLSQPKNFRVRTPLSCNNETKVL